MKNKAAIFAPQYGRRAALKAFEKRILPGTENLITFASRFISVRFKTESLKAFWLILPGRKLKKKSLKKICRIRKRFRLLQPQSDGAGNVEKAGWRYLNRDFKQKEF